MTTPETISPPQGLSPADQEKAGIFLGICETFRTSTSETAVKMWIHLLKDFSAEEMRMVTPKLAKRKGLPGNVGALMLELCQEQRANPDQQLDRRVYPEGAKRFAPDYVVTINGGEETVKVGRFGGYGCGPDFPDHQRGVWEWNGPDAAATAKKVWGLA